jgi:hypothetical protein
MPKSEPEFRTPESLTHDDWRRWASRTREYRLKYVADVQVSPAYNDLLRRILGVKDLCVALGGAVDVVEGLPGDVVMTHHLKRLGPEGHRWYPRMRHDGAVEPRFPEPVGARVVA